MSIKPLASMRRNYAKLADKVLQEAKDPYVLFTTWLSDACTTKAIKEPNAMHLATVDEKNHPAARMVLLKGVKEDEFIFYTNYESRKGQQLGLNPHAALLFWWEPLARQVRITGRVHKVTKTESEEYFAQRPRESQLAARVSAQSQVIDGPETLMKELVEQKKFFQGKPIPRPTQWGGFALKPQTMEFWQGGRDRLHLRVHFQLHAQGWKRAWLAP